MIPEGHRHQEDRTNHQRLLPRVEREESISTKVQPFVEGTHQHQNGFREKTNSGESPILHYRNIKRVE